MSEEAAARPAGIAFIRHMPRILKLAWPVFVGQVAVLAYGTVDTLLVARVSPSDLAALAIGMSVYITIFIGFMGVVLAISPTVGQLFGARKLEAAGAQAHQAVWLALALSVLGSSLLLMPDPLLALAQPSAEVGTKVRAYLAALALSLPAALLFTVYRGFNTAISRPKAVMVLQLGGLAVKVPLSMLAVGGLPQWGVPPMGVEGCGWATVVAMWSQFGLAWWWMRRDSHYQPFALFGRGLHAPHAASLRGLLRLGVPMGLSVLVEVTGFSLMALFIARTGALAVAGHQVAMNVVTLMFMMPMALANATSTLVAQAVGAAKREEAIRLGWHGLALGTAVAAALGLLVHACQHRIVGLYTPDAAIAAAALPLLSWVALFHVADAIQTIAAFVLRAWRVATVPMLIYVAALSGVGLGGGYGVAFNVTGNIPPAWQGARGFWVSSTLGLTLAALAMVGLLAWTLRAQASPVKTVAA
ncbi:MAG: MATE family efflux transporter [Ideonella sp. MAG2]|nr:MAG: MATE family efflux transporter [Ideonella sp. MAG2]